jgi:ferrous iron transport protein B
MVRGASVFFSRVCHGNSWVTALVLALAILLGVMMTFLVSWILSHTLLRGTKTSFLLELPPYRRPQVGKIIIRSFLDRTVFVLFRAVKVAIPAGILIFLLSHTEISGTPITVWLSDFLDPLGALMGLDGVILLAFLLGLPANEIVLPLCVMLYRSNGVLSEIGSLSSLLETLTANGWTWQTAVCFLVFTVMHSPCATTLLTVKKETGKVRYMLLAFLIPTLCGVLLCMAVNGVLF